MTIYQWRQEWLPQSMQLSLEANTRVHTSPFTQGVQVLDLLGERWRLSMTLPERRPQHGAALEAFIARLRGPSHEVALWHFRRPVPRGTLRGAPTLGAAAGQGAAVLMLAGCAPGATLLAGDLLGLGEQLLMVAEDGQASAAGELVVPLANRVRVVQPVGAAVVWNRPTGRFRLAATAVPVGYRPGAVQPLELEFLESWT
ncbi:hypothetical protein [Eleftheria terrae]|uniref:hypothetical protein n=1 Tax=Eleftheria terrae TaxID=1597781 RepID=UPI00263BD57C|nr:hypothetical protein [Eleftheria terrae]WKB52315.1 hypothetical protein N7L95_21365 [Eleftheria terrae]